MGRGAGVTMLAPKQTVYRFHGPFPGDAFRGDFLLTEDLGVVFLVRLFAGRSAAGTAAR